MGAVSPAPGIRLLLADDHRLVVEVVERAGLARRVAQLEPLGVVKG